MREGLVSLWSVLEEAGRVQWGDSDRGPGWRCGVGRFARAATAAHLADDDPSTVAKWDKICAGRGDTRQLR